ncbi:MAG: alanine racemase [Myxococcota bacterium]
MSSSHPVSHPIEDAVRPTHLRVDLARLGRNLQAVRQRAHGAPVLAVVKANAYGHGLIPVARCFAEHGARMLGVAYLEEGVALRRAGLDLPILVMGGIIGDQISAFIQHDLTITASSVDKLAAIEAEAARMGQRAKVHLKVDTGMERIGVHWYSAEPLLQASLQCEHVDIDGIYSHLANSDDGDLTHAREQIRRFNQVLSFYSERGLHPPLRHLSNSGAVLNLPEARFDMVRPGLLLYGVTPGDSPSDIDVQGALRWVSRVVYFKVVQPGSPVSYGSTWVPDRMTRVVTVPVGYGDGYQRRMSGHAQVLIGGVRYPVVGRICMDQIMVDIGWDSAFNGDEVVLLGQQGHEGIRVEDLAEWTGTITYEVLTAINTRVPRIYLDSSSSDELPA